MRFLVCALMSFLCCESGLAAFVVTVDPASLTFTGPGTVDVDFTITHDGLGASSLAGYTFRFSGPDLAGNSAPAPSDIILGATEGLVVGAGLGAFNFNPSTNDVAAGDLVTFAGQTLPTGGSARLFTLQVAVGNESSYVVGVDFQNAGRGFADISNEFSLGAGFDTVSLSPAGVGVDTTFTLTSVAVPEPSSMALLGAVGCGALVRFRKRLGRKNVAA